MIKRTDEAYSAHMWAYRDHLRSISRPLAEEYIRQQSQHVSRAIEELANAVPVVLAMAQLHDAIRHSPAKNLWPIIRETKGVLLVRSTDAGLECPWPWGRTKSGNLRYQMPGHLLFSPWPPNFHRGLRSRMVWLQRVADHIEAPDGWNDFLVTQLPHWIWDAMLGAKRLIPVIQAYQGLAMPDTAAALDRWSDGSRLGSNVTLRISHGVLVYDDGSDRCEIGIPEAFTRPLFVPTTPHRLQLHLVRAAGRAYCP
ncbi:hypothetical protein SAMN03159463_02553 [Mesorhizobium sp. NFR06]|nr:hypothetical protein SAMN03159463_02553 [Mesorhizobium sp. NFR06]